MLTLSCFGNKSLTTGSGPDKSLILSIEISELLYRLLFSIDILSMAENLQRVNQYLHVVAILYVHVLAALYRIQIFDFRSHDLYSHSTY